MSDRRPKTSPAIVQQRTEEILRILLDGAESPWDTCAYVREKEKESGSLWEVPPDGKPLSESQIRRYVQKANQLIFDSCRASRKRLLRRHLAQRRNLYAKAVSQGDVRAALACLDSEAKLTGLFDDELNQLVEKLAKELAEVKASVHGSNPKTTPADGSGSHDAPQSGAAHRDSATAESIAPDGMSGTDAGPVAEGTADELRADDIPPLFG